MRNMQPAAPVLRETLCTQFMRLRKTCRDVIIGIQCKIDSKMPIGKLNLTALSLKDELEEFLKTHKDRDMTKIYTDALAYSKTYTNSLRDFGIIVWNDLRDDNLS